MSELQIVPGEVSAHTGDVTSVGSQVGSAISAGGQVTSMSPEAFGLLCSFFTPPVLAVSATTIAALTGLKATADLTAAVLPQVVSDFEGCDQAVGESFSGLSGKL